MKKAEKEFKIYRDREMIRKEELQSDFDLMVKSLPNKNNQNQKM